ncbi:MAG: putative DNA-binding domain-containing protein [Ferrovibrio sp.]|uniref:HvfC/BufC family peptide modification chaperone n=1 Tax=Ferrovibrio sp. TaxID=1917215 RepID=UPI003918AF68
MTMQSAFAAALLDPALPPPAGLTAPADATQRFNVYRNNRAAGLARALAAGFPATERIVGPDFFAAMARAYMQTEPPRSPVLLQYGATLPDFIAGFAPATDLPYLADVARLEALRTRVYHAADAPALPPATLSRLDPAGLQDLHVTLHPACALLRSAHPAVTIWAMNSDILPLREIADWTAEDALVLRMGQGLAQRVDIRRLPPGAGAFLAGLQRGRRLGEATMAAFSEAPQFDLAAALAALFADGLAIAIRNP